MTSVGRERSVLVAGEALTLVTVFFPVLFYGGHGAFARGVEGVLGALLLGLVFLERARKGPARPVTRRKLPYLEPWLPLVLLAGFAVVHVVQLLPLPAPLVRLLAGWSPDGSWSPLTPHSEATLRALISWLAPAAVFASITLLYDTRGAARRLFFALLLVAAFTSFYGITEVVSGSETIWGLPKAAYRGCVTGSFVNRNNFAAFMTLGLGAACGLGLYGWAKLGGGQRPEGGVERVALLVFVAALCLAGVVLSRSRGGLASVVLVGFPVGLFFVGRRRRAAFVTLAGALVVVTVLLSVWISREPLTQRFSALPDEANAADARPAAWLASVRIFARAPLLGAGAGTFEDQFRVTSGSGIQVRYNHAHSDPLEFLAETGVVGFGLLSAAILWTLVLTGRALRRRHSRFARSLTVGALVGLAAVLVHGLFDFPLQVPGVRVAWFAMFGAAYLVANRRLTR